jgi:hypothetical protein
MGLLDRASLRDSFAPPSPEAIRENLRDDIGLLEKPPRFLKFLAETWDLGRAALLSADGHAYAPTDIFGFDATTKRRLVIEKEVVSLWLGGEDFFQLTDLSPCAPFFSVRELGLSSSLVGIALREKGEVPFALFLFLTEEDDRRQLTAEAISSVLDKDVTDTLRHALSPTKRADESRILSLDEDELLKMILTEGENQALLKISLTQLYDFFKTRDPLKEMFDIRNEIQGLFSSFFNERVQLFLTPGDSLFILQPRELFPGVRLMQNQILLSLEQLLGDGVEDRLIPLNMLPNPEVKEDLENFLRD